MARKNEAAARRLGEDIWRDRVGGDLGAARLKQSTLFVATDVTRMALSQASLNTEILASAAANAAQAGSPWGVGGCLPRGSARPGRRMSSTELRDELIRTVVQGRKKLPISSNAIVVENDKENRETSFRKRESRTPPPSLLLLLGAAAHAHVCVVTCTTGTKLLAQHCAAPS
jgi:hypothetical protein